MDGDLDVCGIQLRLQLLDLPLIILHWPLGYGHVLRDLVACHLKFFEAVIEDDKARGVLRNTFMGVLDQIVLYAFNRTMFATLCKYPSGTLPVRISIHGRPNSPVCGRPGTKASRGPC